MSGIEIETHSWFVEKESDPEHGHYVFAYTITISNSGAMPGQLLSRHWFVTDGADQVEEVEGPGVVGKQPRLEGGESFRYTSAAVLGTPVGSMYGSYEFRRDDDTRFRVLIPAFTLAVPSAIH
ncbi:MAG: Co2+/Mg2+ efflux protein ApaG [Pseudomonadales bacterium]|jgi:ApaG protein|nr:Co2+/Mg2+ efflux protein ApaG [Pseudomonadales bacterium]MDP6470781.1 Co2+/Mg2+ efflux protein ApaG [Pseudomonadales bacterium]MDP6828267.1 Co2+/Mg2+ efflux protein ApaG [Pseudomonadales bacterium]MDP6973011.1 Co2+/Mg2+ efflux protein ApaG [Pseudomonadales bacterium]|tara:strand:- start:2182 stop:2550 length:369 start_codon:yes stop_codon:yes gene_type:complete